MSRREPARKAARGSAGNASNATAQATLTTADVAAISDALEDIAKQLQPVARGALIGAASRATAGNPDVNARRARAWRP